LITLAFMLMFAPLKPLPEDAAAKATYVGSFTTTTASFWDPDVDTWSLLLKPGTMEARGCSHLTGTMLHPVETKWPVAVCKLHQVWWDLTR
jgi:hypothetical protein